MCKRIVRFVGLDLARRFGWIYRIVLWIGRVAFYPAFVDSEEWSDPSNPKTPHARVMLIRVYVALFVWGMALRVDHHPRLGWLAFCLFLLSPSLRLVVPVCRFFYGKMGFRLNAEKKRIRHEWAKTAVELAPTDLSSILLRPAQPEKEDATLLRPLNGSGS